MVAAFDGWVDAGSAATTALEQLIDDAPVVARFDADVLFDYRARRPPLEIVDGKLTELTWHELVVRRVRLRRHATSWSSSGAEPDYRWREFTDASSSSPGRSRWPSGSASARSRRPSPTPGPCRSSAPRPRPASSAARSCPVPPGVLRVPSALVSALELEVSAAGIPALGYFAQVPHYVSGPYATASVELLRALGNHLGAETPERRARNGGS